MTSKEIKAKAGIAFRVKPKRFAPYYMKINFLFLLMLFFCLNSFGQNVYLEIRSEIETESKKIDSVGYLKIHTDLKKLNLEKNLFSEKLSAMGFLENRITEELKSNDSTFVVKFVLGDKQKKIHVYIGSDYEVYFENVKNGFVAIEFEKSEQFLKDGILKLENKGFSLAKLKLENFRMQNKILTADLKIDLGQKRQFSEIVIKGLEKFPEGVKRNIERSYRKKVFNTDVLEKINADFNRLRFAKQTKYPEILFTKDSTTIYVYLKKAEANNFDGFLGFGNDEKEKLQFNGYLDLNLVNILKSGETFSVFWKSDGKDQKTFNASLELPYLFRSPFGLKTQLNIFKQDSTFQTTKTAVDLGYIFDTKSRIYVGYQSSESNVLLKSNFSSIDDYENSYITNQFEFVDFRNNMSLFPEKTKISVRYGFGNRKSKIDSQQQFFTEINLKHDLYLNAKNSFNIRSQNYYLKSNNLIINELYRYGGINSIRGFNENSLQANFLASLLLEYRYQIAPSIYAHTITDYGFYKDTTTQFEGNLLGIGLGFGLLTKNGLLNIIYANGSAKNETVKGSNSIVHISLKTRF